MKNLKNINITRYGSPHLTLMNKTSTNSKYLILELFSSLFLSKKIYKTTSFCLGNKKIKKIFFLRKNEKKTSFHEKDVFFSKNKVFQNKSFSLKYFCGFHENSLFFFNKKIGKKNLVLFKKCLNLLFF